MNKTPTFPHNYHAVISNAIKPALKDFNTDTFYKVSEPHRLQYRVQSNILNMQTIDGYGVCYIVAAKNEVGMHKDNKLFLFILDGDKVIHSTYQMSTNFLETSRIYNTCSDIQKAQGNK